MSDRYGKWSPEEAEARRALNREAWKTRFLLNEQFILAAVKHAPGEYDEIGLYRVLELEGAGMSVQVISRIVKNMSKLGFLTRKQYRDAHNRSVSGLMLTDRAAEMLGGPDEKEKAKQ